MPTTLKRMPLFQILTGPLPARAQRGEASTPPPTAKPRRHEGDLPLGLHAPGGATTGSHVVSPESAAPPRHAPPAVPSATPPGRFRPRRGQAPNRPEWTGSARWAGSRTRPGCKKRARRHRSQPRVGLPLGALGTVLGPPGRPGWQRASCGLSLESGHSSPLGIF